MKKILSATFALAAVLTACSPEIYRINMEVRQPSSSGLSLNGKSMAVVYEVGDNPAFLTRTATAFAQELEGDYFNSEPRISLFTVPRQDSVDVQVLRDLVMDTGEDVVFLLSSEMDAPTAKGHIPYDIHLYIYDSLDKDEMKTYGGKTLLEKADDKTADAIAERISGRFKSSWKTESFSFYWFDDLQSEKWLKAMDNIAEGKFQDAIKIWEGFVKSRNSQKAACAAYNTAQGFFLLGDMDLALRWVDMAERLEDVSLAKGLRARIDSALQK